MSEREAPSGPDLAADIRVASLQEGVPRLCHVGGILMKRSSETFAVGAACTHYAGPPADGRSWTAPSAVRGFVKTA